MHKIAKMKAALVDKVTVSPSEKELRTELKSAGTQAATQHAYQKYVNAQPAEMDSETILARLRSAAEKSQNAFARSGLDAFARDRMSASRGFAPSVGTPVAPPALGPQAAGDSQLLQSTSRLPTSDIEKVIANLQAAEASPALIDEMRTVGTRRLKPCLQGVNTKFYVDCSGSTAGALRPTIQAYMMALGAVAQNYDEDGVEIIWMSEVSYPPANNLMTAGAIKEAFSAVKPAGRTPMARILKEEILDPCIEELKANRLRPESQQVCIKDATIVLIADGIPSADWLLCEGVATAEGVFINGVPAPDNALVAGRPSYTMVGNVRKLKDNPTFDENWMQHDGVPVAKNASEGFILVSDEAQGGATLNKVDTRRGPVLVRKPITLEEVIVAAARELKANNFPAKQLGICLFHIGDEEDVIPVFERLDNLPKAPEYIGEDLRDMVSFVRPKKMGVLTAEDLVFGLAGSRNRLLDQASSKNRPTQITRE